MSVNQKELERLLELKRKQEELQVLNQKDMQEKMKLEKRYRDFLQMSSQQMEEELKKKGPVKKVEVESDDLDPILKDYKEQFGNKSWYKEPELKEGKMNLVFPSQQEAGDFFMDQADQHRSFILVDETNKVLAYSNGDGKLYNGNGDVYTGGEFQASDKDHSNFIMPEREDQAMGMRNF